MSAAKSTTENRYIEAVGRRKTAIARVRLTPSTKPYVKINGRDLEDYFKVPQQRMVALDSIKKSGVPAEKMSIDAKIIGGGMSGQATALRHGIARAMILHDTTLRGTLKSAGMLTRDQRSKERRKFGLKKARKAPQWSKR